MSTHLTSIKCKLFLEGVEVPFNNVTVNERVNNPPTCTVTFPPQSGALKVLPGTILQVFGERQIVGEDFENFLIFEGEVSGINYVKTADSRQAALQAKSFAHQWKKIKKFASDYLPQHTPEFASYYLLNTSKIPPPGADDVEAADNPEELEHSAIIGMHQYLSEAMKAYNEDSEIEGNTNVIFSSLLKSFKKQNFYYAMLDKSLKLSDTFFGFPSKTGFLATKTVTSNAQLLKQLIRGTNVVNFYDLIKLFAEYFNMSLIFPTSPTLTNHADTGEKVPMRGYFVPDLSYSVPIKANIVFPTELHSVSTARNFDAEPTVLVSNLDRVTLSRGSESGIGATSLLPTYMSPGLPLGADEQDKPLLGFTPEERYRGRNRASNLAIPTFTELFMVARAKKELGVDGQEKLSKDEQKELKDIVDTMLMRFTDAEFLKRRYYSRTCMAETDYNPYRIVGFPGLIFDYDGSPSIVGLLEGQTININAEGRATSSLTFTSTRFVWDNTDFKSLIDGASNDFPLYDLTTDVYPELPLWYDENFYSYTNIGVEMYPYVQKGKLANIDPKVKATLAGKDSQWYLWDGEPTVLKQLSKKGGKEYNKNISPSAEEKTKHYDCALTTFARDPESGYVVSFGVDDEKKPASVRALVATIHAVKNIKNGFEASRNKPYYIKAHNHRELINQNDYFKFLGVGAKVDSDGEINYLPQYPNDHKDTDALVTVSACEDIAKNDGGGPEFEKPFSKRRADHVIAAFGDFLQDTSVKKNKTIVTR
jgi:hypothetical protein